MNNHRQFYYVPTRDGGFRPAEFQEFGEWYESRGMRPFTEGGHIVQCDELPGNVVVSTVFLGIDHCMTGGPPVLFETMIFGGVHADYQERYTTYADALEGHARALTLKPATLFD